MKENQVINELINTELTYKKTLDDIERGFRLHVNEVPLFSEIDPLIKMLKKVSEDIIENLRLTELDGANLMVLRQQRTQLMYAFFEAVRQFGPVYLKFLKIDVSSYPEMNAYVQRDNYLNLSSMLVQVIQRGPRYIMLLEAILKHPNGLDAAQIAVIKQLHEKAKAIQQAVNDGLPKDEAYEYKFGDVTRASKKLAVNGTASVVSAFCSWWKPASDNIKTIGTPQEFKQENDSLEADFTTLGTDDHVKESTLSSIKFD